MVTPDVFDEYAVDVKSVPAADEPAAGCAWFAVGLVVGVAAGIVAGIIATVWAVAP